MKKEPVAKKGLAVVKKAASAVAAVKTEAKKESSSSPAPSGPLKKSFSMPGQTREPPPEVRKHLGCVGPPYSHACITCIQLQPCSPPSVFTYKRLPGHNNSCDGLTIPP